MRNVIALILMAAFTVACNQEAEQSQAKKELAKKPVFDTVTVQQGQRLYAENCAQCHGASGEGAENWTERQEDGTFPAPPLNGTGHTWHHPQAALMDTIKNGTKRIGGSMPAWKDKLSDEQIEAILVWAKSQWPAELYQAWARRNQESLNKSKQ